MAGPLLETSFCSKCIFLGTFLGFKDIHVVKMPSSKSSGKRSSSSSSSASEDGVEMAEAQGSSSEDSMEPAKAAERGMVGMWTWPCPRTYPKKREDRERQRCLKPADWDKATLCQKFRDVLQKRRLVANLQKMVIVVESHKKWDPESEQREKHYHLVAKFKAPFAHIRVNQDMSSLGANGKWSFNLCGFAAYLHYILRESSKKVGTDLDPQPFFWPSSFTIEHANEIMDKVSSSQLQRKGNSGLKDHMEANLQRKERPSKHQRKTLTFSEFTDIVVECKIQTEQQLYQVAKNQKKDGHDLLWNFLGQAKDPEQLLARCLRAWHCDKMPPTLLHTEWKYKIEDFDVPPEVWEWFTKYRLTRTLVLSGPGGCGKTALCAALMAAHGSFYFLDKLDVVKRCLFQSTTSLLVDDVCLKGLSVDDCKSWLDNTVCRFAACRHSDGMLPPGMRCFTTNWDKAGFLPHEANHLEHVTAISRRMWWVSVNKDLRKGQPSSAISSATPAETSLPDAALADDYEAGLPCHFETIGSFLIKFFLYPQEDSMKWNAVF